MLNSERIMRAGKLVLTVLSSLSLLIVTGAAVVYKTIPLSNMQGNYFDVIVVLGYPTNPDGSPSPVERARVMEGVREYRHGKASALIMTGGAAHNRYAEADAMSEIAIAQGVPASAVLRERQAENTIQNAYYSVHIMQAHRWKSAEVISSHSHLARASLIFARFPVKYLMHAAPDPPETGYLDNWIAFVSEVRTTDRIRLFGFKPNSYLP